MENPEMGGAVGGAERLGPGIQLRGGGVEKWDMVPLKAEAVGGVIGGGAGVKGGAIVETVAEGTNGKGADDLIGGSEDTGGGRGVEND